jgi:hypothetical protein
VEAAAVGVGVGVGDGAKSTSQPEMVRFRMMEPAGTMFHATFWT